MSTPVTVLKFGGTSLEDRAGFERMARVLRSCRDSTPVAVVSAMSGVTDALLKTLRLAEEGNGSAAQLLLDEVVERHLEVTSGLGSAAATRLRTLLERTRKELIELIKHVVACRSASPQSRDAMTSHGELLSAQVITPFLNEHGIPASYVDARRCILTDGVHGSATPIIRGTIRQTRAQVQPLLEKKNIPVLGGYIGVTEEGVTTTLGRGSSNLTATLVSAALNARETQIWSDVAGVKSADPRLVKSARTISHLSYDEAEEMARGGAKVLHQRMFGPVRAQQIPVRVCNSFAPEQRGTVIGVQTDSTPQTIKAIVHKDNLIAIDLTSTPSFVANGFQHAIAEVFRRYRAPVDVVSRSAAALSLTCYEPESLSSIVDDLRLFSSVQVTKKRAIITCIGEGLKSSAAGAANILRAIDPSLNWQSTSEINLVSVIDEDTVGSVVRRLHQEIFENDPQQS